MKKWFKTSVFTCLILVMTSVVSYAYPSAASLNVPNKLQERSLWCWDASSVSILGKYGKTVSQSSFCTTVKGFIVNETATDSEAQSGLNTDGLSSSYTASSIAFNSIISNVYTNKKPMYAGWTWSSGGGHAMVIDGYNITTDNYVSYMDPGDGTHHTSTYTFYEGGSGYDHVWDGTIYNFSKNSNF